MEITHSIIFTNQIVGVWYPGYHGPPVDVDINTSDTSTPTQSDFWSDYSGSCVPTKQSGILVPSFLFRQMCILFCCLGTTDNNEMELHSSW
jgi:hypothetical protein